MPKGDKINEKQQAFCREYLKDYNATQAAIRAGYSKKTAYSIGPENLNKPVIRAYLKELLDQIKTNDLLTAERYIEELNKFTFVDIMDFFDENHNLKPPSELSESQSKAISSIDVTHFEGGEDGRATSTRISFKLIDKLKAIELALKIKGMMNGERKDDVNTPSFGEKIV